MRQVERRCTHIERLRRPLYHDAATEEDNMTADPDLTALDELPDDARELIARTEGSIADIRTRAEQRVAEIRAGAEQECVEIRNRAEAEVARIEQSETRELAPLVRELVDSLRRMQESYARDGKLDEALAIRARVRQLRGDLLGVRVDPGNLSEFTPADAGRTVLCEVIGQTDGTVWGTDVYTGDSRLAVAVVHAGLLRDGDRGLVRVTILDGGGRTFEGSNRHGVLSFDYGPYPIGYRVERV